jgi:serine O-acetyltransferase
MALYHWLRGSSHEVADRLVAINQSDVLDNSLAGFGMRSRVVSLLDDLKAALFPSIYENHPEDPEYLNNMVADRLNHASVSLCGILQDVFHNACTLEERSGCDHCREKAEEITLKLMEALPEIRRVLSTDLRAAYEGDPAALHMEEILLSYPSIEAISVHRIAHFLWQQQVPIIPRIMSEYAHQITGIDIHPGASIGDHFFIDHGTGVVIGETCVIGRNVKLYQGVTLGARSFELDENGNPVKGVKRHPNIEDDVIIYAGATILGGDTTVGAGSVIGGNVWLLSSVPPGSRVYNATPEPRIRSTQK